LEEPNVEK